MKKHRRRILAVLAALGLLLILSLWAGRTIVHFVPPCAQPCRDLLPPFDRLAEYDDPTKGYYEDWRAQQERESQRPPPQLRCRPLELTLELSPDPPARVNRRYTLSHKVTLRNVSCCLLMLKATPFIRWHTPTKKDYILRVWDPAGKEVQPAGHVRHLRLPIFFPEDTEYGRVFPYGDASEGLQALERDPDLELSEQWDVMLKPGKSITTNSSVLTPYTEGPNFEDTARGILHTGKATDVPKDSIAAPEATPGFRIDETHVYKSTGTYRVQAVYNGHIIVQIYRPYEDSLPRWLDYLMGKVHRHVGIEMFPFSFIKSQSFDVRAESQVLEFEVKP